jgi:hypothetical protein
MAANTVQDDPEDSMSCAYRTHRYRASVTARSVSVSWEPTTGLAHHPIPLRPPVVRPERQAVTATADDAPIPVSLVQYLWSRWHQAPPEDRESVARLVGDLMRSPRWHWDVTVLPDHSLRDPQHPFVTERDGRPTIGMPIDMLRAIWKRVLVLRDLDLYSPIMQRFVSITDPALWQEFWQEVCVLRNRARRPTKRFLQHHLYGYLSPRRLPAILPEIRRLLHSNAPDSRYTALTVLTRWLESPDHETRTIAAQMLHGWTHVVAALVRSHPSDDAIRTMLNRLVPTILTATHLDDRVAWSTTLWDLVTDPTLDEWRRQMSARDLKRMMIHDPMVAALVHERLRTVPLTHPSFSAPVWNILIAGLMRTGVAGEVLEEMLNAIEREIFADHHTIPQIEPVLATCWGTGHDHRILQIIDAVPGPHWKTVLTQGMTTSVGAEVCDRIRSWSPPDEAVDRIVSHIRDREGCGDWPLEPLPEHLIPWVGKAARVCPYRLYSTTIRRLWLADPNDAWNVSQTMLGLSHDVAQVALAAMDAGWGRGHDDTIAATLRKFILNSLSPAVVETGIATAVAGIGTAPPSIMESLLTALVMQGNENVQRQLISALHRGWGRGQDDLVLRIVAMIAERTSSEWVLNSARATLIRAWRALPPHVVVSLIDWLVTRAMDRWPTHPTPLYNARRRTIDNVIAALAPIWTALPSSQGIASIARHVNHLHTHAHTLSPYERDTLVPAWASVIVAGADRLSAADLHALLDPLWTLSPHGCLTGIEQGVRR